MCSVPEMQRLATLQVNHIHILKLYSHYGTQQLSVDDGNQFTVRTVDNRLYRIAILKV